MLRRRVPGPAAAPAEALTAGISQILAKEETPLASGEANDAAAQRGRFVGMLIYERRDSRSPEKKQYRSGAEAGAPRRNDRGQKTQRQRNPCVVSSRNDRIILFLY